MPNPHPYKANRAPMDSDEQRCLDCGESPGHPNHQPPDIPEEIKAQIVRQLQEDVDRPGGPKQQWVGDAPFWLMFQPDDGEGGNVGVDLDEPGWIDKNKAYMRQPGTWLLMAKRNGRPLFSVVLKEGDQFYFTKRHVGNLMAAREVICYGIGKKKADGTPVNLWLLPNGMVCGGDDVDILAARMIK